jgi:hypothetical protein
MRFEAMGNFVSRGLRPLVWQHPCEVYTRLVGAAPFREKFQETDFSIL